MSYDDLLPVDVAPAMAEVMDAVGLGEFQGAVLPEDASAAADVLARHGITDVARYPRGDEAARIKAIADLARRKDLLFMLPVVGGAAMAQAMDNRREP